MARWSPVTAAWVELLEVYRVVTFARSHVWLPKPQPEPGRPHPGRRQTRGLLVQHAAYAAQREAFLEGLK